MTRTFTREEIREVDRVAIEEYGIPGVVLMENAGRFAAQAAMEMLRERSGDQVAVFCGKGNNGGDGFVLARHMINAGYDPCVCTAAPVEKLRGGTDAGINLEVLLKMGVPIREALGERAERVAEETLKDADLIVDALLGTGISGPVREPIRTLIERINAADCPVLAIDIPSGLDCNTGAILGAAVRATATVTFVGPKAGFFKADGAACVGRVHVADIGAPKRLWAEAQ